MKSRARVVIVGGGVMGVSLLYHLAEEGWDELVLVEKGELTSGSTWHAAGQCPHFAGSLNLARVHKYGTELYPKLEELTGHPVSWHGCGGIRLARTEEEVLWFKHVYGISKLAGYEAHLIGPNEIKEHHPYLDPFGVKLGFLTVTDGHVAPADITEAMAAGARAKGAAIYRRCRVTMIEHMANGNWLVRTENGDIECEHVVNAAGSYADVVGSWTGHNVPIANMLHHYVITDPIKTLIERDKELPVIRDPHANSYLREETSGILVGPYETQTAHVCWNGEPPPWDFESELIAPELERILPWLEQATERLPMFGEAGIKSIVSGAIPHTPDANYLTGPAHGPRGYWMCCGSSVGIAQGAGAGKYLAQWMVHGQAEINMREFDPRRFGDYADHDYSVQMGIIDYQHMYYCYKPGEQHTGCRPIKTSAVHDRLRAAGGQFQEVFGWERARWFDPTGQGENFSFKRSNWWQPVKAECRAVREAVGLTDLSAFAKFEVTGTDAEAFLERVCANRAPARDGAIVLGHLLTDAGFIDSEVTVTRLGPGHYYLLSSAIARYHDHDKLAWQIADGEDVRITDVTGDFGCLVLAGPKARQVLAPCTDQDLGNAALPWLRATVATVAGVEGVRLLRVNYVGELGWELHCPVAGMAKVFDALMAAGAGHGITLFGAYAMNALRMEKAYRGWGGDLTNEITMIEADMERFVKLDKDFTGRAGTLKSQQEGARTKLVYIEIDAVDHDSAGNEPVYDGETLIGLTTGGAYGHWVEKSLAFAYVDPAYAHEGQGFDVLMHNERRAARVIAQPAYDPGNERLRG